MKYEIWYFYCGIFTYPLWAITKVIACTYIVYMHTYYNWKQDNTKEALKAIIQFQSKKLSFPKQDMNPQPLAFMAGALITIPPSRLQTGMYKPSIWDH